MADRNLQAGPSTRQPPPLHLEAAAAYYRFYLMVAMQWFGQFGTDDKWIVCTSLLSGSLTLLCSASELGNEC